jgi:glutamine synthetase
MRKRLPRPIFEAIHATVRSGEALDMGMADVVASAMKDWALEHGATHYTHWFQPMTGATAEKHDAFLSVEGGGAIEGFSGAELTQAEPDASSFPSGGMRSTFEARGYTAWDPTSPAFLLFNEHGCTLTIPSVFMSYTGEALDAKTPLLRSMRELSRVAVETANLMGRNVRRIDSTLGAEQEYFLIQRAFFEGRPDLEVTGRTVIGTSPPKGQQMEDNYFGAIDDRALDFMGEVEAEAWKLGIPVKTRHNEVAPHQYEAAPIYSPINRASDQNQLLMDLMRRVARRRDLAVLFHEKPFSGVNGSGKHNNWSMADDLGRNLLQPSNDEDQNCQFLFYLTAVLKAVHRRAGLLRASIATVGNDHRLGANEAPPAIMSVFLGSRLTEVLDTLAAGKEVGAAVEQTLQTGLASLPHIRKDNTDRNRTSPFAFTGNKFEFRAVGSSQSNAMPMTYLNLAVAEALAEMGAMLRKNIEAGEDRNHAILEVVRHVYRNVKDIVFNGNNYGDDWLEEAARRGLPNEPHTPAALEVLRSEDTAALFEKYGVLKTHELQARYNIRLEQYNTMLTIEAVQMLRMAKTGVLPVAYNQQREMAEALFATESVKVEATDQRAEFEAYVEVIQRAVRGVNAVRAALRDVPHEGGPAAHANHGVARLIPAMNELRDACDTLERRTDESAWPFPSYHQMLFQ